jgi:CRISPR-associated exonuclease Cas4
VQLNKELREETRNLSLRLHEMIRAGRTPGAAYTSKCRSCSLFNSCMPKITRSNQKVADYLHKVIYSGEET